MSSDIRIRVATGTAQAVAVTLSLNGPEGQLTDTQVAAILTRAGINLQLPMAGTAEERVTEILIHVIKVLRARSRAQHQIELEAANSAAIQAQLDAEDNL